MNISLDYDGTYSVDPVMWDEFIEIAKKHGHSVTCVTMRYPSEEVKIPCEVVYTSRNPKRDYFQADVWIDDMPQAVFYGAK